MDKLIFCDVETTGLDSNKDRLLEVGLVVVNRQLQVLAEKSWVLMMPILTHVVNSVVEEMHTKSGLFDECRASKWVTKDVQLASLAFLNEQGFAPGEAPLCGSSVHFDRGFLRAYMPELDKFFHYRNVDVSTLKNLVTFWAPELALKRPPGARKHRSLPDCHDTIEELKFYRECCFLMGSV